MNTSALTELQDMIAELTNRLGELEARTNDILDNVLHGHTCKIRDLEQRVGDLE